MSLTLVVSGTTAAGGGELEGTDGIVVGLKVGGVAAGVSSGIETGVDEGAATGAGVVTCVEAGSILATAEDAAFRAQIFLKLLFTPVTC